MPSTCRLYLGCLTAITLMFACGEAIAKEESESRLDFFGELRLRLEQDWGSRRGDETKRDDRLRLRFRLRGGFVYKFGERWSARFSVRSGQVVYNREFESAGFSIEHSS